MIPYLVKKGNIHNITYVPVTSKAYRDSTKLANFLSHTYTHVHTPTHTRTPTCTHTRTYTHAIVRCNNISININSRSLLTIFCSIGFQYAQ